MTPRDPRLPPSGMRPTANTVTCVCASGLPARAALREAVETDIPTLTELARAFYDEDGFATSNEMLVQNFEVLVPAANARVMLALEAAQACGFALTTIGFTLESGTVAELQDLYVRPEHRRRGLASLLIEDAADWARSASATLIDVVVAPNGRDVNHLLDYYRRRGFLDDGRQILSRPCS